jgi:DNA-binding response OmpR family regulator
MSPDSESYIKRILNTMNKHVLLIDDDTLFCRSLAFSLQNAGYETTTAGTAEEGLRLTESLTPDVVLLDIGLPQMDGLEAIRALQQHVSVPIILVTARRRDLDEIIGLEVGADDYITKPFDTDVLLAHIRAVLRRSQAQAAPNASHAITVGDLCIDPLTHIARIGDRKLDLSPKEFDLLLALAREAGRVFSVDELVTAVWGDEWVGESQTVYVHICRLREKMEQNPQEPRWLLTVRGAGYKLSPYLTAS